MNPSNKTAGWMPSLILPVYLPTLFIMVGYSMIIPVLPLFARTLGAGLALTGVVVSMRGAGALLFDLPAGALISRVGKLSALLAGVSASVIAAVATGLVKSLLPLALLTVIMGGAHVVWIMAVQTHIRQSVANNRRGRAMALIGGMVRIGGVLGPILGGYVGRSFGLNAAYFGQALFCFVGFLFLLLGMRHFRCDTTTQKGLSRDRAGVPFGRTLRRAGSRILVVGLVVISLQLLRSGRQTLLPLWGERIRLDVAAIGLIFGLSRAVELLLFYPAGMLMDRLGRKSTMVPCLLLLSIGLALVPITKSFAGLLAVGMIAGVGNGLGSGIVLTLGADLSPRRRTGEFLGLWHLVSDVGTTSGPLLIGVVAQALGLAAAPVLVAVFGLAGAWLMAFRVAETLKERGSGEQRRR